MAAAKRGLELLPLTKPKRREYIRRGGLQRKVSFAGANRTQAAGVAVEDMLQDAVQRQRVLNEYEDKQRRRLEEFEKTQLSENQRLGEEMEVMCAQYRTRIATGVQEIERERATFREWQERKEREQRRISEAASACVSGESSGSSDVSISRLLEKNSGRLRELA